MSKRSDSSADSPSSFEAAIAELEDLIDRIESGQIGLEQCLTHYERGMKLIGQCRTILGAAQARIAELKVAADGSLQGDGSAGQTGDDGSDAPADSIFPDDLADDEA